MRRNFPQPQWEGEPLTGKTILIHMEQGFGDAIQFVRYITLVAARGAVVILESYPELMGLMRQVQGVALVIRLNTPPPPIDYHVPMMSLPRIFQTDLDSIPAAIPYLRAPENRVYQWRTFLGPRRGKRIGVVWSGNPHFADDSIRTIPLSTFRSILEDKPDREFFVIQTAVRSADAPVLQTLPHVKFYGELVRDFEDTTALISLMDLVICVDTSVAHLAGAMGWPVWLLIPVLADWRWMLNRDDSPWYPTMWIFRQQEHNDWETVLAEVARQLDDMLS
jgi:hypothetical protein